VASATGAATWQSVPGKVATISMNRRAEHVPSQARRARAIVMAALRTLSLYSFLAWAYVAALAVFRPNDLPRPLTRWAGGPRTDTFGEVCFAISFATFVAVGALRDRDRARVAPSGGSGAAGETPGRGA
jgi:hypothetical protein